MLVVTVVSSLYLQPGLLADYSDPCDVKKQIIQHTVDLLSVNGNADVAQQSDDDYSVPYDVKRKMQGKHCMFNVRFNQ
jgi:hypothetical protein